MKVKLIISLLFLTVSILIVLSSVLPWWYMSINEVTTGKSSWVRIYAWGLVHNMSELREFVERYETPQPLMQAAKGYLAALVFIALISSLMVFKAPNNVWKLALIAGITYFFYTIGFIPLLYEGTSTAPRPIPLQGEKWEFVEMYSVRIVASFDLGYYLSLLSAALLLVLGLITWRKFSNVYVSCQS